MYDHEQIIKYTKSWELFIQWRIPSEYQLSLLFLQSSLFGEKGRLWLFGIWQEWIGRGLTKLLAFWWISVSARLQVSCSPGFTFCIFSAVRDDFSPVKAHVLSSGDYLSCHWHTKRKPQSRCWHHREHSITFYVWHYCVWIGALLINKGE